MVRIKAFRPSLIATSLAIASLVPSAAFAAGPVVNGGFEAGNLSGWTLSTFSLGSAPLSPNFLFGSSFEGNYFAQLSTAILGVTGVTAAGGNTQLGLTAGTLGTTFANLNRGVVLTQNVAVAANSKLTFACKFSTLESNFLRIRRNDVSFFSISGPGTNVVFPLADVNQVGSLGSTGWLTDKSYTFANAGAYTIGFGVYNRNNNTVSSTVRLDAVQIQAIPEPGAVAFGVLSFGAVAGLIARRRRQI